jgi:hypothetical protein
MSDFGEPTRARIGLSDLLRPVFTPDTGERQGITLRDRNTPDSSGAPETADTVHPSRHVRNRVKFAVDARCVLVGNCG